LRVALVSDANWRNAVAHARGRGADLICLPHLSFTPYFAASRDRGGLELAERAPSRNVRDAVEIASGGWIAASAYESEGEGVFYVTGYLAGPETLVASSRQHVVEACPGRYEQMFISPGHEPPVAAQLPGLRATALVGADLGSPAAWAAVVARGATCVLGGASAPDQLWDRTCRVAAGMAAAYGITALLVNREDDGFAGGGAAFGPDGAALRPDADGFYDV
jgi:N-carbamoylputrescine amidase